MNNRLKPFYFKVENGAGSHDNYIGYWLVFAIDTKCAIDILLIDERFKKACPYPPTIEQVEPTEMLENFHQQAYEINYDCYN